MVSPIAPIPNNVLMTHLTRDRFSLLGSYPMTTLSGGKFSTRPKQDYLSIARCTTQCRGHEPGLLSSLPAAYAWSFVTDGYLRSCKNSRYDAGDPGPHCGRLPRRSTRRRGAGRRCGGI